MKTNNDQHSSTLFNHSADLTSLLGGQFYQANKLKFKDYF